MKKQFFSFLLIMLMSMAGTKALAYDAEIDGIYYNFSGTKAEVTSYYYDKYTGSVVIPETVSFNGTTYSVTTIGYQAFYMCFDLTSVTIPNSVTSIDDYAFETCWNLTSITIPNSVTTIGDLAFYECSGLTSINIPNSVTTIGSRAFSGTAWYDNQPDGVVYAGKVVYTYKGEMPSNTSIILKDGTVGIADEAFSGCDGLTSISIPNSVTVIGGSAFYGCI